MGWHYLFDDLSPMDIRRHGHPRQRPRCLDRRFPGSHIQCCLYAEHDDDHESDDGDRWRNE